VLNTAATPASPAGSYPITAAGAAAANYAITFVAGTLTVTPASAPRLQLRAIRAVLAALPRTGNRKNDDHVSDAIQDLDESIADSLWIDNVRPSRRGERIFEEAAEAAEELMAVSKPPAAVTQAISQLVAVARQLATAAIQSVPDSRVRRVLQSLADAQQEIAEGDLRRGRGLFDHAIQEYGEAWHDAQRAMSIETDHDDHDHDHNRRDHGARDDR
jgi:hypothetical protein